MAKSFVCSSTEPIVKTKAGAVRGFILDGTYTFHGIKYADAGRFRMPTAAEPFEDVYDATSYGFVSPMMDRETARGEIMVPHRYWPKDENCQYLNVWSQSVDPAAKKPVMVWLHGGGFSAGSSIEQICYDGENLSKFGDVVVVSINHRLNILGYLDLSQYGERYKNSGNVGNGDLVAALRWIHENIEQFGGDPGNVTIFGQSGGGAKVASLMQTPAADGLFHKGIIMSGIADGIMASESTDSKPLIEAMLAELGLTADDIGQFETLPYETLVEAYQKVVPPRGSGGYAGCAPIPDDFYLGDARKIGFTDHAKTIPLLVGTVLAEFGAGAKVPHKYEMSQEEKMAMLRAEFGDAANGIAKAFTDCYPEKCVTDVLTLDSFSREPTKDFVRKKAQAGGAPVYNYLFNFEFPVDDGKPAWHCSDLPFVFHNTDKVAVCNVPGVSDQLEEKMAGAWVSFAKYGVPGCLSLPAWPACTEEDIATMVMDRTCEVRHNFDDALYEIFTPVAPNPFAPKKDTLVLH